MTICASSYLVHVDAVNRRGPKGSVIHKVEPTFTSNKTKRHNNNKYKRNIKNKEVKVRGKLPYLMNHSVQGKKWPEVQRSIYFLFGLAIFVYFLL